MTFPVVFSRLSSPLTTPMRCTRELDLRQLVPCIKVPVYVLQGSLDVMAPVPLVEDWLARLDAPAGKRLFRFEGAGHNPIAEAPERALAVLRTVVLEETCA